MTEAWVWLRSAGLQLQRILTENNGQREIMDAHLFLLALRQVIRGVEMSAKYANTEEARRMIKCALKDFDAAIPGGKDARDVIEHFDEYTQGIGRLQQPNIKDTRKRSPSEEHAERFQVQFDWRRTDEGRYPIMKVGPFTIELIAAEDAAVRMHCALWETLKTDEGQPVPPGWAYNLNRPHGPRRPALVV